MKKTMFIMLWMVAFWIAAVIVWSVGVAVFVDRSQAMYWSDPKTQAIILFDRITLYGFPAIALILGIFGKLPGTRSRKLSV
jgi:hypothetical protein